MAYEAKVGFKYFGSTERRQFGRDLALLDSGDFQRVEWHFYPSAGTQKLGLSRPFIDAFAAAQSNNYQIAYYVHLPATP